MVWIGLMRNKSGLAHPGRRMMNYNIVAHMAGATSVIISNGQTNEIYARRSVSMRGVLVVGSISVAKIPFPGADITVASRFVRKVKGGVCGVRLMERKGSMTDIRWRMMYYYIMANGSCTIGIMSSDRQADIVGAGRSVGVRWVLFGAGIAVPKIPFIPRDISISGGLILEDNRVSIRCETKAWIAVMLCISLLKREHR